MYALLNDQGNCSLAKSVLLHTVSLLSVNQSMNDADQEAVWVCEWKNVLDLL